MEMTMENKMTAVEWLVEQIKNDQNQKALSASEWMQVIEEAKQMEKDQIKETYDVAYQHGCDRKEITSGNIYYNETYKK